MTVIVESISAGLIISLINKCKLKNKLVDQCRQEPEDEYYEVSSAVAGVSDSSCGYHVHLSYYETLI